MSNGEIDQTTTQTPLELALKQLASQQSTDMDKLIKALSKLSSKFAVQQANPAPPLPAAPSLPKEIQTAVDTFNDILNGLELNS